MTPHTKVHGGTPSFSEDLCPKCKFCRIVKGVSLREEIRRCSMIGYKAIPFKVEQCKDYMHKNHPYVSELEEIAWVLVTKNTRRAAGFVRMSELSEKEKRELGGKTSTPWEE